jgi:RNA polymerase sigma-70 factor, ECF subfamily
MDQSKNYSGPWRVIGSAGTGDAGDQTLRAMYDEHATALFSFVLRLLNGDRYQAEDIVQETLLRCWSTQDLTLGADQLRPWLFRVARNLVIDTARRQRARPREVDGTGWLDKTPATEDSIDQLLASVMMDGALEELSPAHREVLVQTYFVGRPGPDLAASIGVSVGTVKSRLHYALQALRRSCEERGITTATGRSGYAAAA